MRIERADSDVGKGWCIGSWNSDLPISVGFANEGIDEPHLHRRVTEIYLVARGTSVIRVADETAELRAGDVVVIEPGEAQTFVSSSPDYLHFVAHVPGLTGAAARQDKAGAARDQLGL